MLKLHLEWFGPVAAVVTDFIGLKFNLDGKIGLGQ